MSSITAIGPGMAYVNQLLASALSPVSAVLATSKVKSALQSAPAGDIVQLSEYAVQLGNLNSLFGISNPTQAPSLYSVAPVSDSSRSLSDIIASINAGGASSSSADPITSGVAYQAANYQYQIQGEQMRTLMGANLTAWL